MGNEKEGEGNDTIGKGTRRDPRGESEYIELYPHPLTSPWYEN
jgi:hypothetical protein